MSKEVYSKIQLFILLDQPYFATNDLIKGSVHIKSTEPLNICNISLSISKYYNALLSKERKPLIKKKIYEYNFSLFESNALNGFTKIVSGHNIYPFKFYLKPSDGSTCYLHNEYNNERLQIENIYELSSNVRVYGFLKPLISTERRLIVAEKINYDIYKQTEKIDIELATCFFFLKSNAHINSTFKNNYFFAGDFFEVDFNCLNGNIRHVTVYLFQALICNLENNRLISKSTIIGKNVSTTKTKFECKIHLPSTLSPSVLEKDFEIKYYAQILIKLERSSPIWWRREVFILNKYHSEENTPNLNLLKGEIAEEKYFILD